MKTLTFLSMIYHPRAMHDFAAGQSKMTTVAINVLSGIFVVAAASLLMPLFSVALVVVLSLLFGPFIGILASSIYPRIEWTVGKRMRGKASFDDLYRVFTWTFLLSGFALLLYSFILSWLKDANHMISFVVSIPSLIVIFFALRNYCSNIIAARQFTRMRGAASIFLTFILFLVLIAGGMAFFALVYKYGTAEGIKTIFMMN